MGSHRMALVGAVGLALCGMAASPVMSIGTDVVLKERNEAVEPVRTRRSLGEAPVRYRRSRGQQAKPARKPNRLTTSKRVRRKHRRAA